MSKKTLGSVESLISAAWSRTRQRFLSFFLASLMMYALFIAMGIAWLILSALLAGVAAVVHVPVLQVLLFVILGVSMFIGVLFIASWSSLATITTIVNPEKIGVLEAFKKVKPIALPFVWVQILMMLFFIGLMPVSAILLFIPLFIWYFWANFIVFVYLEKQRKGLENLWVSRAMVNQNFWGIIGRMFLLTIAILFFTFLFSASRNGTLIILWQLVNILIIAPFWVSYSHEIYSQLDKKESAPVPKVWIVVSIVGFVIMVLLAGTLMKTLQDNLPEMLRKQTNEQLNKEFDQKYQQELKNSLYNNSNMRPAKIKWDL